jgi:hypothetical protein
MPRDPFSFLMAKWSAAGEREIRERWLQGIQDKKRRQLLQRRVQLVRRCLLLVVLAAVASGVYFRDHIGGLAAEMTVRAPDPSLIATPASKAKIARKMAELRKEHEDELEEIMK